MPIESKQQRLLNALALAKAKYGNSPQVASTTEVETSLATFKPKYYTAKGDPLNERQTLAVDTAANGDSFVLIGGAGCGKTATLTAVVQEVCRKYGGPSKVQDEVAIVAFTRRACSNAAKAMDIIGARHLVRTIHKQLKYQPISKQERELTGGGLYAPTVTKYTPNKDCKLIIVEEASMVGYETLYRQLKEGHPNARFIFVGDLNQLKPVMGHSVLGFKLTQLPVIELNIPYRQALDSDIISFQYNYTLAGRVPTQAQIDVYSQKGQLKFFPISRMRSTMPDLTERICRRHIIPQIENGSYNVDTDIILIPQNVGFGQIAINCHIAQYLSKKSGNPTYEIFCGINTKYLAVGDKVQADKQEAIITKIEFNNDYIGKMPRKESLDLDRFGVMHSASKLEFLEVTKSKEEILAQLTQSIKESKDEDADEKRQPASHKITVYFPDLECESTLETKAEVATVDLGYALTVHRSQGSEWRKVILILHCSHHRGPLYCRELFYTGGTRPRELLEILYTPDSTIGARDSSIATCITRQSLPGKTWQEKAKHFADKMEYLEWRD